MLRPVTGRPPATHDGQCSVCTRWLSLRTDGTLIHHRREVARGTLGESCQGSGMLPTAKRLR